MEETNTWPPPERPAPNNNKDLFEKITETRRPSLEVGAGLNFVRPPRAKAGRILGQGEEDLGSGESWSNEGRFSGILSCQSGELLSMVFFPPRPSFFKKKNGWHLLSVFFGWKEPQGGESETERRWSLYSNTTVWDSEVHLYLWERTRVYIESYRRFV